MTKTKDPVCHTKLEEELLLLLASLYFIGHFDEDSDSNTYKLAGWALERSFSGYQLLTGKDVCRGCFNFLWAARKHYTIASLASSHNWAPNQVPELITQCCDDPLSPVQ